MNIESSGAALLQRPVVAEAEASARPVQNSDGRFTKKKTILFDSIQYDQLLIVNFD